MSATTSTTAPTMTGLTWQAFLDLPVEHKHAYLINGELFVNPPVLLHQQIVTRLLVALENWITARDGRGEVTFDPPVQISHDRGYMPDIAWWAQDKCAPAGAPPEFDGPPDLVVEVLSPSTRRLDTIRKRNDYPRIGVGELWLIDPDGPAALLISWRGGQETVIDVGADGRLGSPQLGEFAIRLGDLTAR